MVTTIRVLRLVLPAVLPATAAAMSNTICPTSALNEFLQRSHTKLHKIVSGDASGQVHVVMGNEAADPDSCVCAIAMAAALDASMGETGCVAPLIAVPRADFKLQLDRVHLLRRAHLKGSGDGPLWTPTHVTFGDELDLHALAARPGGLKVHLVDHNKLSASLASLGPNVASIVDHHADEALYGETVAADSKHVELGIGSCASLVAERLQALGSPFQADPALCTLLLGAIVLDTVNLDPTAKAQKPREQEVASEALLPHAAPLLGVSADVAGRTAFFDELIRVKADISLLSRFPTADLLRQDYKEEAIAAGVGSVRVGVGSVVLPLPLLLSRQPLADLAADFEAYAQARQLRLLLLMSVDLPARQRYLLLHCTEAALREEVLRVLEPIKLTSVEVTNADGGQVERQVEHLRAFEAGDYSVSRKVLLPMLRSGLSAAKL